MVYLFQFLVKGMWKKYKVHENKDFFLVLDEWLIVSGSVDINLQQFYGCITDISSGVRYRTIDQSVTSFKLYCHAFSAPGKSFE